MGTSLTGLTPSTTYDALIKVGDNGPLSATAKYLSDGLGNDAPMSMSTSRVGIGTNNPAYNLHINAASDSRIIITDSAQGSTANDGTYIRQSGVNSSIVNQENGTLQFGTNNSFVQTILANGNVGIGTSSPVSKLDLTGDIRATVGLRIGANADGTTGQFLTDGTDTYLDYKGNLIYRASASSGERARLTEAGYFRMASGTGGIQFNGDTAAANALDDYEEGTFTPSVAFGGASTGITYFDRQGNYTKIGRQVTCTMYIAMTNVGSSTGIATIEGLPFTCSNLNRGSVSAIAIRYDNITSTGQLMGNVVQGSTQIGLSSTSVLGADTALNNTNFNGSSEFNAITVTYFV
jgi:hypothetical protein